MKSGKKKQFKNMISVQSYEELKANSKELERLKSLIKITGLESFLNTIEYLLQFDPNFSKLEK